MVWVVNETHRVKRMKNINWVDIKDKEPPQEVNVHIRGTYYGGDWFDIAYRKDYKKGSSKSQLRRVWRWMKDGNVLNDQNVEAWAYIDDE